jgi:hypothetical protein
MQPDTGHLVDLEATNDVHSVEELESRGYLEVPGSHIADAIEALDGKSEVYLDLASKNKTAEGRLAMWAAKVRKDKKARHKAKLGSVEVNRRRENRRSSSPKTA